jgi:type II secretory pathway component GspD/PulD (secretin)
LGGIGGVGGFGLGAAGAGIAAYITGIQQIVGIPTLNAILVRGTPEAIEELRRLLDLIDVPPDQVEIESQFVSVVTNLQNIVGIDWSVAGTEVTAVTAGMSSPGSINIGLVRGNLSATLGALIASNRGRVIQAPRAFTINGLPAIFVSAVARPFFIQQAITDAFGNVRTVTLVNIAQITIALIAIPFINEDGTVTVFTQPIVQDIVGEVTNPIGGTVPIITSTFTVSLVRVRSGDSFAIGGLLTTRTTQEDREIPLLARLPLIGGLFRRKSKITDETNLIIFITPRIVPAEEIASS